MRLFFSIKELPKFLFMNPVPLEYIVVYDCFKQGANRIENICFVEGYFNCLFRCYYAAFRVDYLRHHQSQHNNIYYERKRGPHL